MNFSNLTSVNAQLELPNPMHITLLCLCIHWFPVITSVKELYGTASTFLFAEASSKSACCILPYEDTCISKGSPRHIFRASLAEREESVTIKILYMQELDAIVF